MTTKPHKKLNIKHEQYPDPSFKVSPATKPSFDPFLEHIEHEERGYELQAFQHEPSSE